MSRIAIPAIDSATGATADIYAHVKKIAGGRVPNTFAHHLHQHLQPYQRYRCRLSARRVKSFISLDSADHLLTRRAEPGYAVAMISTWASRYLVSEP